MQLKKTRCQWGVFIRQSQKFVNSYPDLRSGIMTKDEYKYHSRFWRVPRQEE